MNQLFCSYLVSVLELFQPDIVSVVFEYKAAQILEIILLNFYLNLYQTLLISYHNTYTFLLLLNHNSCFTSCNIFANFEGGKRDIGKYPFDML